jgi:Ca-activated chloride channel family protein
MDEQQLKDMLSHVHAPEPKETSKNQALNSAMAAFDQKMQKKTQGVTDSGRLTDINNFFNNVRRLFMQKRYVAGMTGTVSVIALMAGVFSYAVTQSGRGAGTIDKEQALIASAQMAQLQEQKQAPVSNFRELGRNIISSSPSLFAEKKEMEAPERLAKTKPDMSADRKDVADARMKAAERVQTFQDLGNNIISSGAAVTMPTAPAPASAPVVGFSSTLDNLQPQYYQDEGRDKFQSVEENTVKSVATEPVSTFSIDVDTSSYSFMRRQLNNGVLPQKDAVRIEEMVNYFDYNYALPEKGADPFQPTIAVYDAPWHEGHKIIHVGIKGYDIETKPKSNLVFLIDTSGSMNSPDKLPLLVNSFKLMLDSLSPDDTVGIVVYAGSAGTVLEPTKAGDKQKIIEALERLQAGGSTAGAEGIRQAYSLAERAMIKDGNNRIILATDGDFNVGITNPEELKGFVERKREEGISLSVLGFGEGNYNDQMMQTLAQNGNGNAAYIDSLSEARKVLVKEASSTLFTIAKDVKIQVEFNPAMVSEYRLIGYETRHLNREDFNNDKVDAGEVGAGHAVTAIYEITPTGGAKMVDDLRYAADKKERAEVKPTEEKPASSEYAFLKIRYKQPDGDTSKLMTRPITPADDVAFGKASDDVRFASAVAGFGQLLKGSKYAGTLTYDQVIDTANSARGKDEFGYRAEFVNLVRLAKSTATIQPQQ